MLICPKWQRSFYGKSPGFAQGVIRQANQELGRKGGGRRGNKSSAVPRRGWAWDWFANRPLEEMNPFGKMSSMGCSLERDFALGKLTMPFLTTWQLISRLMNLIEQIHHKLIRQVRGFLS
jgi:hypothetical protein